MEYILDLKNVKKTFSEVQALKGVSFKIQKGEVHALHFGENGAGKSTLVKCIAGAQSPDPGGEIYYRGKKVNIKSPIEGLSMGISVIYQEFNLIPHLSIAENIFLGREPTNAWGAIDWKKMHDMTRKLLSQLDMNVEPDVKISELGVAQKQMVEISKALSHETELLFMDEPTASLTEEEIKKLFAIIRDLKSKGVSIVYISTPLR